VVERSDTTGPGRPRRPHPGWGASTDERKLAEFLTPSFATPLPPPAGVGCKISANRRCRPGGPQPPATRC